jgi:hypothetical protein
MNTKLESIKDRLERRFNIGVETPEPSLWEMAIFYYTKNGISKPSARTYADEVCHKTAEAIAAIDA